MRRMILALALAILPAVPAPPVSGAPYGDPARGRGIAAELCARCHAIGGRDESRNAEAPPFREIVQRYPVAHLEEALAEGILVGHDAPMPQFTFSPEQIDDLLAYLDGLGAP